MTGTCPQCKGIVEFSDVRLGRCPHCSARICVPRRYYRPASIATCIFTILVIAKTGGSVWTSPAVFSYVMLWMVLMFVVFIGALVVFSRIWMLMFSPPLD